MWQMFSELAVLGKSENLVATYESICCQQVTILENRSTDCSVFLDQIIKAKSEILDSMFTCVRTSLPLDWKHHFDV